MSQAKTKITLAASVGIASLLAGSAAQVASAEVLSFQNGVNGYTGTFDRRVSRTTTLDANGSTLTGGFGLDGGHDTPATLNDTRVVQGMIRFDNIIGTGPGLIPPNALILSASIDGTTTGSGGTNGAFTAYQMSTPFDSSTTWASLGGDGLYNNVKRMGGSFSHPANNAVSRARVDQIVQDWVNGGTNYGFGIRSDNTTDGWGSFATGAAGANASKRPKLTVSYTTNPNARYLRYQQNINGYTGSTDSFINGYNADTVGFPVSGAFGPEHGFLDGSNGADSFDQPYLVKFDGIDLSSPEVTRAELVLHSGFDSANSRTNGSFSIHRILKPWQPGTTYASLDSDGNAAYNPTSELIANGFLAPASTETGPVGDAATINLDVTDAVQAWKEGAPNYGFYIASTGTADGWELYTIGAFGAISPGGFEVPSSDIGGGLAPELSILYAPPDRLYWDIDGVTPGSGGATPSGNWDGTATNFTYDAAGGSASTSAATSGGADVVFAAGADAAGAYTVTVSGTQSAKSVQIARGNVTFTGGAISTPTFDVTVGASGTVNSTLSQNLTKTGAGTLTLGAANTMASTTVSAGMLVAAHGDAFGGGSVNVADGAVVQAQAGLTKAVAVSTLTTNASGKFDVTNNSMVVKGMTDAQVRAQLQAGYNGGAWNGATGILSSTAAASTETSVGYASNASLGLTEFKGVTGLDSDDVIVKYTYAGDANLDGKVDIGDLGLLAGAWQQLTGKVWFDGDFTYDGAVNIGDLGLLAGNWQKGTVGNPSGPLMTFDEAMAQFAAFDGVVVPEPASLSLLAFGGLALGRRRRRTQQN